MNVGAPCIGCTMPSFPDGFAPFYKKPPGTFLSSNSSRVYGAVIRRLRESTNFFQNRTRRWEEQGHVPSGWGHVREPYLLDKIGHFFYQKMQQSGTKGRGSAGKK
jgi:hydrogenase small subunit